MIYYKLLLTGRGILIDHYGSSEPLMGFVACRILPAESEAMAIAQAKRDILVHWNQSFNADRKAGLPKLSLDHIVRVNRWLTRRPKHDYYFYVTEEQRQEHLAHFIRPKRRWLGLGGRKSRAPNSKSDTNQ